MISVDEIPEVGVVIDVKEFDSGGWYVDLNTRGVGFALATIQSDTDDTYIVNDGPRVLGRVTSLEGAMWLALAAHVNSEDYAKMMELGKAPEDES